VLDAAAPWAVAVAPWLPLLDAADPRAALTQAARERMVVNHRGAPIAFVDAADASAGTPYESHIAATGRVPTRLTAHDLLNALVWLALPRLKCRLNALQAAAIARDGVGAARGPLRDAATVFDENGALLLTQDATLLQRLRARDWREACVAQRARWAAARVVPIGHALLAKLAAPYKAITAHVLPLALPADAPLAEADGAAAACLGATWSMAELFPLPLLGVPGWWPANADAAFYDDGAVFRSPSARGGAGSPRG
jgi:hypothetical protein